MTSRHQSIGTGLQLGKWANTETLVMALLWGGVVWANVGLFAFYLYFLAGAVEGFVGDVKVVGTLLLAPGIGLIMLATFLDSRKG